MNASWYEGGHMNLKIFVLLPFLSSAMPYKKIPHENKTQVDINYLTTRSESFYHDIFDVIVGFAEKPSTIFSLATTHRKISQVICFQIIDELSNHVPTSSKSCEYLKKLNFLVSISSNFLQAYRERLLYIFIPPTLPIKIKNNLNSFFADQYTKSVDFENFGSRLEFFEEDKKEVEEAKDQEVDEKSDKETDEKIDVEFWINILRLGCVQEELKSIRLRNDLTEDEIIPIFRNFAARFKYIKKETYVKNSSEYLRFKEELKENAAKKILFIINDIDLFLAIQLCECETLDISMIMINRFIDLIPKVKGPSLLVIYGSKLLHFYETTLQNVRFTGSQSDRKMIGNSCFAYMSTLRSVDFSPFSEITTIGHSFLRNCKDLIDANGLKPFTNLTTIGESFLSGTSGLNSIDLTPLNRITQIEIDFLSASGITNLDLAPLSNVTHIGPGFLCGCCKLTDLDLKPLSNLTKIDNLFLANCRRLKVLNLDSLNKVTSIGSNFLHGCEQLTEINLNIFKNFSEISPSFLIGCSGLKTLDLGPLRNVSKIRSSFLYNCSGLTNLDLSPLSKIRTIPYDFLSGCSGLTTLDLSPLRRIKKVDASLLSKCDSLKEIYIGDDKASKLAKKLAKKGVILEKKDEASKCCCAS